MKYYTPTASCNRGETGFLHTEKEICSGGAGIWKENLQCCSSCHHSRKSTSVNVPGKCLSVVTQYVRKDLFQNFSHPENMFHSLSFSEASFLSKIASMALKYWAKCSSHLSMSISHTFCFAEHDAQLQVLLATQFPDCQNTALSTRTHCLTTKKWNWTNFTPTSVPLAARKKCLHFTRGSVYCGFQPTLCEIPGVRELFLRSPWIKTKKRKPTLSTGAHTSAGIFSGWQIGRKSKTICLV